MPKVNDRKTTLEKIESEIAECKEIIRNKKAQIRELETAAAIIRRVEGRAWELPFAGKKIRECAEILLKEKSPRHFKEIANEAIARGYESQTGGDLEIVAKSFWTTMTLFHKTFEKVGAGKFALKEELTEN